jgi:pimeloyl-ACP methyl ester carboxylesterase
MRTEEGVFENKRGESLPYRLSLPDAYDPDIPLPTAVFVHGFGGSMDSTYITRNIPHFIDAQMGVMVFNMCNTHRDKICTKNLTPNNALDDVTSAFEFAKQDPRLDSTKQLGIGASFGAYSLMRYAAHTQDPALQQLILYSTVPDPVKPFNDHITWRHRGLWWLLGHIYHAIEGDVCAISYRCYKELNTIDIHKDVAPLITAPVMCVQGARDNLASVEDIQQLQEAMVQSPRKTLYTLPEAGHAFQLEPRPHEMVSEMDRTVMWTRDTIMQMLHENKHDTVQENALWRFIKSLPQRFGFSKPKNQTDVVPLSNKDATQSSFTPLGPKPRVA